MLTLKDIMTHLLDGGRVGPKTSKDFRGMYIKFSDCGNNAYIAYNHYGSSAVKVNYTQLEWLVNEIFDGLESLELKGKDYFVYA